MKSASIVQPQGNEPIMTFLTRRQALILAGAFALLSREAVAADEAPPTVWDLADLFPTPAAWKTEHDALLADLPKLAAYKGRLGDSVAALQAALQTGSDLDRRLKRLSTYATLKADENLQEAAGQERRAQAVALEAAVKLAGSWISPELLALDAGKIHAFLAATPGLGKFRFYLLNLLRQAPHTLNAEGEALLALATEPLAGPERMRSQLVLSDIPWPTVMLSIGERRIDDKGLLTARTLPDRADRKKAYSAFFGTLGDYESSLGAALAAQVNGNVFQAKARHYPDALAAAMADDNIPTAVYRTLIAETHNGLPVLHRYLGLRRRLMGLPDLASYDLAVTATRLDRKFDLGAMRRLTLQATAPLGPDYVLLLERSIASHWMHASAQKGKAAGAYMNGSAYDVHPYLLLNLSDHYDSLSTFAHEWGHAMHSLLANQAQPFATANYSIFIAEIASTLNEHLLAEHMYRTADSKEEKLFVLDQVCTSLRTTFFRQAMFGEFELAIHEAVEKGEPLSGEKLTSIYSELLGKYHGGAVAIDPPLRREWAAVQHFYWNFYVYQYATSIAASAYFADRILGGAVGEPENYLDVLRAGGSDYPVEILKRAGLDMTTPAPYRALVAKLSRTIDEMEKLL
jgi:oligoendopeptidase F